MGGLRVTVEFRMLNRHLLVPATLAAVSLAACGSNNDTTGPSPIPAPASTISYTAIGARDALGIGATVSCVPWDDCPNGRGYVHVAARELRARGFVVNLNNLGFPGAVLSRRLQNLGSQYGAEILANFM